MVYVDQPAGTGFSPGPCTVKDEEGVADEFKSWFKFFVDTFNFHGYKVYITGESYAGQYIPYIASAMLDEKDTYYFNDRAEECGYNAFFDKGLTYPPQETFPIVPDLDLNDCGLWDEIIQAVFDINPCFNFYHLTDSCLYLWDEMG